MWISTIYSAIFLYNILSIGCGEPGMCVCVCTTKVPLGEARTFIGTVHILYCIEMIM